MDYSIKGICHAHLDALKTNINSQEQLDSGLYNASKATETNTVLKFMVSVYFHLKK